MQSHWQFCKDNFPHADVADPGLEPAVAQNTLRISIFYAYQSVENPDLSLDDTGRLGEQLPLMLKHSTDIIRYISASNWIVCSNVWRQYLQNCTSIEGKLETRPLRMIDNMSMDLDCLSTVIKGILFSTLLMQMCQYSASSRNEHKMSLLFPYEK
jgi:hypothetical protein